MPLWQQVYAEALQPLEESHVRGGDKYDEDGAAERNRWSVPMCPVTGSQGKEISTPFSSSPPQQDVKSSEITPELVLLQIKPLTLPQSLLIKQPLGSISGVCLAAGCDSVPHHTLGSDPQPAF